MRKDVAVVCVFHVKSTSSCERQGARFRNKHLGALEEFLCVETSKRLRFRAKGRFYLPEITSLDGNLPDF